jgi:predicted aminopeptidase
MNDPKFPGFRPSGLSLSGKVRRARKWLVWLLLLGVVGVVSGCQTLSYYAQAVKGQYQIFALERPIEKLLADSNTPPQLKARLVLLEDLRRFAKSDLSLPVDGHYLKYTDVHRPFVVWNVEAAPEFSLQPKTWWYPLVGSLEYRGYFSKPGATNYAARLRRKDLDVYVGGVEAYSTLGWFRDPVLNTFIFEPDADLAEIIFHELGHARVFARGDTDFNEAYATTVGQEGARRWLKAKGNQAAYDDYLAELHRTRQFVHLIMETRTRLEALYGDAEDSEGRVTATATKRVVPRDQLREQKQRILTDLRRQFAQLKTEWHGNTDYDQWFAQEINNAKLNSVAAYYDFLPGFEHLLERHGGDLEQFYQAVERLSKMPKKQRHQWLRTLAIPPGADGSAPLAAALEHKLPKAETLER